MKKKRLDYLIVYLGCFIQAFAITCILKPNNLTVGGITGLSLTIGKIISINYTYLYYFICLLILFTAKIFLGNKEAKKIILLSTTYPLILMIMNNFRFNFLSDTPDKLLICIYYGIFMGVGTGLVLKKGFSQGSSDTLSKVIQLGKNLSTPALFCLPLQDQIRQRELPPIQTVPETVRYRLYHEMILPGTIYHAAAAANKAPVLRHHLRA